MRFLHTADWHLGRLFYGIHLTADQAYLLDQLKSMIKESEPDLLIVAGDLYDRAVPHADAVNLMDETLTEIILSLKTPVLLISGNHDDPSRIGFASRILRDNGLHIATRFQPGKNRISLTDQHGPVEFCLFPYSEPSAIQQFFPGEKINSHQLAAEKVIQDFQKNKSAQRQVLIAHLFLVNGQTSDTERPLSVGGADQVKASLFEHFHYVALGHLHRAQFVQSEFIRYSGSLAKMDFSESEQTKGVNLVEIDQSGNATIEFLPLTPKRETRKLSGPFESFLKYQSSEDFIALDLTDRHLIVDPMSQLRNIFPNLMHLTQSGMARTGNLPILDRKNRTQSATELFKAFYQHVYESDLEAEKAAILQEIINKSGLEA